MSVAFDKTTFAKERKARLPTSRFDSEQVALFQKWYGCISTQTFNINRKKLHLTPQYLSASAAPNDLMHFLIKGVPSGAVISIEKTFLAALFSAYSEPIESSALSADDAALLFELSFAPVISAFEQTAGVFLKVVALTAQKPSETLCNLYAGAYFESEDKSFLIGFSVSANAVAYWNNQIEVYAQNKRPSHALSLPLISARLCLAIVDLTIQQLSSLSPGDLVMLGTPSSLFNEFELCVGPRCAWKARRRDSHVEMLGAAGHPTILSSLENADSTTMTQESDNTFRINDIPVQVAFEIGKKDMSVAELKTLHEGTIIEFPGCDFTTVSIVVNGCRIGTGTLVEVDNSAGVRIERIFAGD